MRQMSVMNILRPAAVVAALALAAPAVAQSGDLRVRVSPARRITTSDIQRLQDQVYDASNEVSRLRSRDQNLADRLQSQLDDLRDEVVYLRSRCGRKARQPQRLQRRPHPG